MKGSSKKLTDTEKWPLAETGASRTVQPKSEVWVVSTSATGRFAGIAKTTERVTPVIIPGYKTRG